jgi:hypothetical protein
MRYARVLLFLISVGIITGIVLYFIQRDSAPSEAPSKLNNVGNSIKEKLIVPDWLVK